MSETNEQNAQRIRALIRERAGYAQRGLTERVKQVDAELKALGAAGKPPAKRATKLKADKRGAE